MEPDTMVAHDDLVQQGIDEAVQGLEAQPDATTPTTTPPVEDTAIKAPEPIKLDGFKLYDAKGELVDVAKLTPAEAVTLKKVLEWQIGYNAMNKEQRKTLKDLTRVASLGHYNEKVLIDTRAERAQALTRAQEAQAKVDKYEQDRGVWDQALTALVNGNPEPMTRLAHLYQQELAKGSPAIAAVADPSTDYEAAGQQFVFDTVMPRAAELAQQYGANAGEITKVMVHLMQQEGEFLTEAKIQDIMTVEMPAILENGGYTPGELPARTLPVKTDPRDTKIAELQAALAEKGNASLEALKNKGKKMPPAGGGSPPAAGSAMPSFKSASEMKRWLQESGE